MRAGANPLRSAARHNSRKMNKRGWEKPGAAYFRLVLNLPSAAGLRPSPDVGHIITPNLQLSPNFPESFPVLSLLAIAQRVKVRSP